MSWRDVAISRCDMLGVTTGGWRVLMQSLRQISKIHGGGPWANEAFSPQSASRHWHW